MNLGQTPGGWFTLPTRSLACTGPTGARISLAIQEEILSTALSPGNFAQAVVDSIACHLRLTAASLYIRSRGLASFRLKAATGFPYDDYDSLLLEDESYLSVGCQTVEPSITVALAPLDNHYMHHEEFLRDRDIEALIVVPFYPPTQSDTDYPDPLGAMCLYAPASADLDEAAAVSCSLQRLVGALYVASLERQCMQLRSKAVELAAFSSSLTETTEGLIELMCKSLDFDAGSVWLLNPHTETLNLRAVFPQLRSPQQTGAQHVVRLETPEGPTRNPIAIAFHTLHTTHHPHPPNTTGGSRHFAAFDPQRIVEQYGPEFHNTVAIPLRMPRPTLLGSVERQAVGVITLTNNFGSIGSRKLHVPTTWEELKLAAYMAEITSVLIFQGLKSIDHEADYERRIHGLKTNLASIRNTLLQLQQRGNIDRVLDSRLKRHLPDALERCVKSNNRWVAKTRSPATG